MVCPILQSTVGNINIRPGFMKLKDLNGDGVINADDRKVIGNALPDFQGGFGFNVRYKNLIYLHFLIIRLVTMFTILEKYSTINLEG